MHDRFHGRTQDNARQCSRLGCHAPGEFRAPARQDRATTTPPTGDWQWLCLVHVREFNARYDYFAGMSQEEIEEAQRPVSGWATESLAFVAGGVDRPPPWADFNDPLDAISGRFRTRMREAAPPQREDRIYLTAEQRSALAVLNLDINADKAAVRKRYSALARKLHPDRNGGDRSTETRLQRVVEAYQQLRKSTLFD